MDLIKVMETFPTQVDCIVYLERLRWQGMAECPHCRHSLWVRPQNERDLGVPQRPAWYLMARIRAEMGKKNVGIFEAAA